MAHNSLVHFLRYTHTMVQDRKPSLVSQLRTPSCTDVRSTVCHRGRFHLLRQVQQGDANVACSADALQSQRRHCHRCATSCDSAACQSGAAVGAEAADGSRKGGSSGRRSRGNGREGGHGRRRQPTTRRSSTDGVTHHAF